MEEIRKIIKRFLPKGALLNAQKLSGGVIHQTYKIEVREAGQSAYYILQCMNTDTFKNPDRVMSNTHLVQQFLLEKGYPLQLSIPLMTTDGNLLYQDEFESSWRFFKYIKNSVSYEIANNTQQIYEAGKAFGLFLTYLKDFDARQLETTIPNFHNLSDRFFQFENSIKKAELERREKADQMIKQVVDYFNRFQTIDFSNLPNRAVHNDCKLSNLLFDKQIQECIAVIDLDTLMPGYIVTDFGDMVRTMCTTATEDEVNLELVAFDAKRFEALHQGFLATTGNWLIDEEHTNLINGAIYIILEQAIRFLSDYLNQDQYYVVKYPQHNFDRAKNQLQLLGSMLEWMKQNPIKPFFQV